jgi:hypothetical protein
MLAIAAVHQIYMIQFNICTTFLNADLYEEIFMEQPEGYIKPGGLIYKLMKNLYGLKQAAWCIITCVKTKKQKNKLYGNGIKSSMDSLKSTTYW